MPHILSDFVVFIPHHKFLYMPFVHDEFLAAIAALYVAMSVGLSVGRSVGRLVGVNEFQRVLTLSVIR